MVISKRGRVSMKKDEYIYECELIRVVDGDTVRLRVDLGFNMTFSDNFRLFNIDAPELRGEERSDGLLSKQFLIDTLVDKKLTIRSHKYRGKYGRYIVDLYADDEWMNALLVKEGHAIRKEY